MTENRPNNGKPWADADDAELRSRVAAGEFLPALAKALGRSQEAVRTRANILRIPVRSSARGLVQRRPADDRLGDRREGR